MGVVSGGGGGGGGSAPVTVTLVITTPMDIHAAGGYGFLWDRALDNYWDFNTLTALPAGLGLSVAINGTDGTITTTAAGTWAFTLAVNTATGIDATWAGGAVVDDNTAVGDTVQQANLGAAPSGVLFSVCETITYPVGAAFLPKAITNVAATANPFAVGATLIIVRLA